MAKSKSNSKKLSSRKKELIKLYIELRKRLHREPILLEYEQLINKNGLTRYTIAKTFRNYGLLREEGEKAFFKSIPKSERALLSEKRKVFDQNASADDCIDDLRRVQNDTPHAMITRNHYREYGKYSDSTWSQYFGTFQEFRRQAGLELNRHQHKLEREIARHASHTHYNDYFKKEILPYFNKYEKVSDNRIKTIMVISDIHDIECDRFTLNVFIDTCKRKQPDVIVLNGDIFDFYEFSKFTKDPRQIKLVERFEFIWDNLFKPLREHCPNSQIDFIMGNHEYRLIRLLADATPHLRVLLGDVVGMKFSDIFKVDEYQINWVSKADFTAFNKRDINNELKKNYRIYYGCYVVCHEPDKSLMVMSGTNGHHHRLSISSDSFLDRQTGLNRRVTWAQTPAAHVNDAEYLANSSKWNTGFLEATINIDTKEVIQKIHQTHGWTVIDGVLYERKEI